MRKILLFTIAFTFSVKLLLSQSSPFTLELEQTIIPNAPNIHSCAFAQSNGKWLFIGGRTNGLHGFSLGYSFQPKYQNRYAWVVDPVSGQAWSVNLYSYLPVSVADPLRSMNMQFYQEGDKLFISGGYGLDSLKDSLVTFPNLMVVDISAIIQAIINGANISPYIRQITDERMRVCGAGMEKVGDYTFLPGGHNFWGEYTRTLNNQIYTNRLRKFKITDNGTNVSITDYSEFIDTVNYHRRDYNLVHAIRPNGSFGLTLYGGVFKYSVDLPYQNPIYFDTNGAYIDDSCSQKMSQYTSANFIMYDSVNNNMHTTFLGGTSLYYFDQGSNSLVRDTLVPFIKDITTLTRASNGACAEYVHPVSFPVLIGTNAMFFLNTSVPHYSNGVIKLASLSGRIFIGYMFGGILADFPNMGTSRASDRIYKIYVTRNPFGIEPISNEIPASFGLSQNYPNPFNPLTIIIFDIAKKDFINITVYDMLGREIQKLVNEELKPGKYSVEFNAPHLASGIYFCKLISSGYSDTKKMILVK